MEHRSSPLTGLPLLSPLHLAALSLSLRNTYYSHFQEVSFFKSQGEPSDFK